MSSVRKIIGGTMITLASLSGCQKTMHKATLNAYMTNRPVKEFCAIKAGWRDGILKYADEQHSLDSVALVRIQQDSDMIKEINEIFNKTKLKNHKTYRESFDEIDNKMINMGITTKEFEQHQKEYARQTKFRTSGSIITPFSTKSEADSQKILKLRQFKLDSMAFCNKFYKGPLHKVFKSIKKRQYEHEFAKIKP